jgi:uncharacterized membrane protein (DUF4010 family)
MLLTNDIQLLLRLLLALAFGLLIGLERGWRARQAADETRIAGWRSFALLGILGGLSALLDTNLFGWVTVSLLLGVTLLLAIAYGLDIALDRHWSITSSLAALTTFALGALAMGPYAMQAVAATVVVTTILALREQMHGILRHITPEDLHTTLRFLLIALVILPWLPNRSFGPFDVLNPFQLWAMVVLISGLSFIGYFAMRLLGQSRGIMITAATGGLVSSTAITLALARMGRTQSATPQFLAAGILLACALMPVRMLVLLAVLDRPLLRATGLCLTVAAIILTVSAMALLQRSSGSTSVAYVSKNPLDLRGAALVTAGIAMMMMISHAIAANLDDRALVALGALTGAFDVDAMLVSMAALPQAKVPLAITRDAILAGALANSLMKASIALVVAPHKIAQPVILALLLSVVSGTGVWLLQL